MKIKDLLCKSKGNYFVTTLLTITCLLVTMMTINDVVKFNMFSLCYPLEYPWQLFSGVFVHGTPDSPMELVVGHIGFILALLILFGLLIEKVMGSNRFSIITLIAWGVQAIVFVIISITIVPEGETGRGAGFSGIAFMYGIIGAYILFELFRKNRGKFFKQVLTYIYLNIFIAMLVMLNPYVAGMASFIIHMVGVLLGIILVLFNRKYLNANLDKLFQGEEMRIKSTKWNLLWVLVPIFFVVVYVIL